MKRINDMFVSFKGIRHDEVGAKLASMPIRQKTALKGNKQTLPGRDGFVFISEGYSEVTIKQDFFVASNEDLQAVRSWLNGSGELIFGDYPDYAYDAMILTVIPMSSPFSRLEGQKLGVTFTCQPFMHLVKEKEIVLTASTDALKGRGDVNALPLLKVEGSGSRELVVNGRSMILTLTSGTPLYIDCDAGTAFTINSSNTYVFAGQNVTVVDDWYELLPAGQSNVITIPSGITKVTITPRWRFL